MIIVSNTSPITSLSVIGLFDVLHHLYAKIHIPEGVWQELNAYGKSWPGSSEVAKADWIEKHRPQNQALVRALQRDLDLGESETISLALELQADLVLLDEKPGRRAAQRFGLRPLGVVGILLEAKKAALILHIRPHLDALREEAGFYISEALFHAVLLQADEQ